jgi:nucleoside-diphosphate-sugar epimerase
VNQRIVIAGASGFIGRALIQKIKDEKSVIALSRQRSVSNGVEFRQCDLFSLRDSEESLRGADIGIYLVHSMLPSARLTQGEFQDFDLIAADNFARAAKKNGLKQIIYLGGLVPNCAPEEMSPHLRSRQEVEEVLKSHGVPVTVIRTGLIMGPDGSSFQMLYRLIQRLPAMILPAWTQTQTVAVSLADVIRALEFCLGRPEVMDKTFDLGMWEFLNYRELLLQTALKFRGKPRLLSVPFFSIGLSRLWVRLVTGASMALVKPLLESLKHELKVDAQRDLFQLMGGRPQTLQEVLRELYAEKPLLDQSRALENQRQRSHDSDVRSVQRLKVPSGVRAVHVAQDYMTWLPRTLGFLVRVHAQHERFLNFDFFGIQKPLLVLQYEPSRSQTDRQLFYVREGLLSAETNRGRLEFREVLGGRFVMAALHEFRPKLPWYIYRFTQAQLHLWVMKRFQRHLNSDTIRQ